MLPIKNTSQRYGILTQLFHWSIAILFLVNFYLVYRRDYISEQDPLNLTYIHLHKALGVFVLFLGILFLTLRFINARPSYPLQVMALERVMAKLSHYLLFFLIISISLSGILMSIFNGRVTQVFTLFVIPALETPNQFWGGLFHQAHVYISYLIIAVVSLHVLAALRHHFWLRDNVLRRMLPVKLK